MSADVLAHLRGEGDSFWVLGDHYTFKLSSEESPGALAIVELTAFPKDGPPRHIHHREDESFYIVEGTFSVQAGDRTFGADPGAFVPIPKGTLHTYRNVGATLGRVLAILKGGFENLWREIGEPASLALAPRHGSEDIIQKLMVLAPKYHLEIPPPPFTPAP
jgi:mannose-6-phosphate isomerase-like protein (cupin superfamily)